MQLNRILKDEAMLELLAGFNRSGAFGTVVGSEFIKMMNFFRPFFMWPIVVVIAAVLRGFWPANEYALLFTAVLTVVFIGYIWYLSGIHRKKLGTYHSMLTVLLLGGLLFFTDALGWTPAIIFLMVFGVPALCLSWSIRAGIARHGHGNSLDQVFAQAGLPGAKIEIHKHDEVDEH